MNDAMSFGMHRLWKKILVELAAVGEKDVILDIASGTGDIAKLISKEYPNTKIFMSDINYEMLDEEETEQLMKASTQIVLFVSWW